MNLYSTQNISNAVAAICPDIQNQVMKSANEVNERRLWWELSTCILSSQVPYSLATAFSDLIDSKGILLTFHSDAENTIKCLVDVLKTSIPIEGRLRSYRFPVARAHHLAAARDVITAEKSTLSDIVVAFKDPTDARTWLVKNIPGIGPKQASMFLRNSGVSYDLAILDRHVLNYMSVIGIYTETKAFIPNIARYQKYESLLRDHAQMMGCTVGVLDWAIWIVMRIVGQNQKSLIK